MNARVGMVIGLVVVMLALAGFGVWRWSGSPETSSRPGTLSILSSPAGAKISIEGKVVGETPWFSDNTWPRQPVLFELSLPGYRTWKGSFSGGVEARMDVTLSRRKLRKASDAGVIDGGSMDIDLEEVEEESSEFVDEDLDREAAAAKGAK
ncbi:MAG: PEGA domain-containing protein [Myxococcales bacterium]|nr:PEGA domain-containing protein [Myxococcales bacterium]